MKNKLLVLIVVLLGSIGVLRAQTTEFVAELDTNYMLIGDQIHLRLKVKTAPGVKVVFPQLKDTITRGIEIISGPLRDSLREKDGRVLIEESYLITSFDSGMHVVPPIPIQVAGEGYNNVLRTDPIPLVVNTFVVDQEKGNYDIVMPMDSPWSFMEVLPYLLWIGGGLLVIIFIILLIVRLRTKKPLFVKEEPVIPPYELAMRALDEIKEEKLWQSDRAKDYYTRLTDAVRAYINGELHISAMEQTSFEIIRDLEACSQVDGKQRSQLAMLLETSDFVKFAKAMPLPEENKRNLDIAYDFVNETNERVKAEQQRAELEALKRKEQEQAMKEVEGEDKK